MKFLAEDLMAIPPGSARPRGRASPFLPAFAVPMRFAVGAGSNKRTVGRFSFCGLLPDPYSLPVSLFRGGAAAAAAAWQWERALPLGYVPFLKCYPLEKSRGEESWALSLTVPRQAARRAVAFRSANGRNYHFIDIESPSSLRRDSSDSSDALVLVLYGRGRVCRVIFAP